jgi:protein TonB
MRKSELSSEPPAWDMAKLVSNTDDIGPHGSIDQFALQSGPLPDRLPPMLFLAALIHGILIIGVTFNVVLGDEFAEAISLEVTIVADPDPNAMQPDEAEYLAQADQEGAGNTQEQARPSSRVASVVPIDNLGEIDGNAIDESTDQSDSADQVLTSRTEQDLDVLDRPREDPTETKMRAALLESGVELTLPLPQDDTASAAIRDDNPRELVTSVDTRESKIAGYLSTWKSKIESIGVRYFPERRLIDGISGSPTLEVTITASGQLQEVIVRKTSGSKKLDQAALNILRRAAPFDPFPEAIRVDYDQLRFAYKWQFNQASAATTASTN